MDLFLAKQKIILPIFLLGFDFSISDFTATVLGIPMIAFGIMFMVAKKLSYFPSMGQNALEFVYETFHNIFKGYLGRKGNKYIPFLFSLMCFIFLLNLGNLLPFVFPCTSQLALTLTLGILVFVLVVGIGFYEHGNHFWHLFIPHGIPNILKPFLFVLELFSFLIRPLSLALRLAINMVAGHVMLHVIGSFAHGFSIITATSIAISTILSIFEIGVAALQAYVFAILSCIYIADVMHGHEENKKEK